eukprot:TRINITY_DN2895_c0_g1_i1.p1 TRINITY_DN2895_c0_g1~~TRINITY_DN2895_c0_g1_i1.p1  ORF type:complete len:494 (-),score=25.44 TRINITY_DN2895_c0_g1_i1:205-1686(-)
MSMELDACDSEAVMEDRSLSPCRRWQKLRLLGSGSFGQVSLAVDVQSGNLLAVKSAGGEECSSPRKNAANVATLENEISILKDLNHKRIVRYIGDEWSHEANAGDCMSSRNLHPERHLLMEYVAGGSLLGMTQMLGGRLEEPLLRKYLRDVVEGLAYVHSRGIVHGDIKALNLLVSEDGVKIADFGTSWRVGQRCVESGQEETLRSQSPTRGMCGTVYWMSPEMVQGKDDTGTATDLWSLGCTMIELAQGKPAWQDSTGGHFSVMYAIGCTNEMPSVPEHLSAEAKSFLSCCLQRDPHKRWKAESLLRHPFLRIVNPGAPMQAERSVSRSRSLTNEAESVKREMRWSRFKISGENGHACSCPTTPRSITEVQCFDIADRSDGPLKRRRSIFPLNISVFDMAAENEMSHCPSEGSNLNVSPSSVSAFPRSPSMPQPTKSLLSIDSRTEQCLHISSDPVQKPGAGNSSSPWSHLSTLKGEWIVVRSSSAPTSPRD